MQTKPKIKSQQFFFFLKFELKKKKKRGLVGIGSAGWANSGSEIRLGLMWRHAIGDTWQRQQPSTRETCAVHESRA